MAGVIPTIPRFQFSDTAGVPLAGGTVDIYLAGTTTRANTWQDRSQTTLNTNPVTLDAAGSFIAWLDSTQSYKFVVKNALGVVQSHLGADNISGAGSVYELGLASGATLVGYGSGTVGDALDAANLTDYTSLRAYAGTSKSAYVTGYLASSAPSGIAGLFTRDDSDTTSADNGGTIIVASNGKRWKRVFSGSASPAWFGVKGDNATNDGAAFRSMIAALGAGSSILIKAGTYLLNQDGANPYCVGINKRLHFIFEPGVVLKATTAGVRSVMQISAAITCEGAPVVDGAFLTNQAVELVVGASGTTLRKWEGKNVTQQYSTAFSAAVFAVVSEIGIVFDECYAHDATSYPNAVIGDTPGAARGFHFYGTAPEFGMNAVVRSRVDNIMNTNGLAGNYEDEDGIVSQMTGSFCLVDSNTITNCMKRGVKMQDRGIVSNNVIISTRTEADNVLPSSARMYSGISLYSDDVVATGNRIGSGTCFGLVSGGSFLYGIEMGGSGLQYSRMSAANNSVRIGTSSDARGVEFIRLWGAAVGVAVTGNKITVDTGPTVTNAFGVRTDFDHASVRASVDLSGNILSNLTYGMQLRGGFSGSVANNHVYKFNSASGGIVIDTSASALRPASVSFVGNCGYGTNDYTVRVNDTGATAVSFDGTKTESTTTAAVFVAAGIVAREEGSYGLLRPTVVYVTDVPPASGTFARGARAIGRDPRAAFPVVEWRCVAAGTPGTWQAATWLTIKGTTGNRPTLTASDLGVTYLDITLDPDGKPIWWTGTAWVDATGAVV